MPIVERFQFDSPTCGGEGIPEEGGTKKRPAPPYGWYEAIVSHQGWGTVRVATCSLGCLPSAIDKAERDAGDAP